MFQSYVMFCVHAGASKSPRTVIGRFERNDTYEYSFETHNLEDSNSTAYVARPACVPALHHGLCLNRRMVPGDRDGESCTKQYALAGF